MALSGRYAPSGAATKILASNGAATFDGAGHVTFNLTANTVNGSQTFAPRSHTPDLFRPIQLPGRNRHHYRRYGHFAMVAYNFNTTTLQAKSFQLVGTDATYATMAADGAAGGLRREHTFGAWAFSAPAIRFPDRRTPVSPIWPACFNSTGRAMSPVVAAGFQLSQYQPASYRTYTVTGLPGTISLTDTANNTYSGTISVYGMDTSGYPTT